MSAPENRLAGFIPPISTPMKDGKVDVQGLERLVDYLAPYVSGYLVGGSVGENPSLSLAERALIAETVAARKRPEHVLAVSVADNALPNCAELARIASQVRADLAMILCPSYFTNTRDMLCSFMAAVGSVYDTPLCLYDNPLASGVNLSVEDIVALDQAVPQLRYVKVTDIAPDKVTAIKKATSLGVYAGDDIVIWHMLARGAQGAMVALPIIYPKRTARFWDEFSQGDRDAAYRIYQSFTRFIHLGFGQPDYVQVIKVVLHEKGVIDTPEVRLPLLPLHPVRRAEVLAAL